jgi:hypothetical protein
MGTKQFPSINGISQHTPEVIARDRYFYYHSSQIAAVLTILRSALDDRYLTYRPTAELPLSQATLALWLAPK